MKRLPINYCVKKLSLSINNYRIEFFAEKSSSFFTMHISSLNLNNSEGIIIIPVNKSSL